MAITDANQQGANQQVLSPELGAGIAAPRLTPEQALANMFSSPKTLETGLKAAAAPEGLVKTTSAAAAQATADLATDVAEKKAAADKKATADAAAALEASKTSGTQMNAIAALTATMKAYGLGEEIATAIKDMVVQGYTADTITLIAQDPTSTNPVAVAMQKRFAGNAERIKNGMAPLSPAEYIATERSYRQIMQSAGLPKGFYDTNDDFTKFISKDVSPTELKTRVDLAANAVANADPAYTNALTQMYGLSTGDMIAHVLDEKTALPILQKQAAAVEIGTAAQRQGMAINAAQAELYGASGVTQATANQAFTTIASALPTMQELGTRYQGFGPAGTVEQSLQAATLGVGSATETPAQAEQRIKRLQEQEVNLFGGSAGASQQGQSLGIGTAQGVS